MKIAVVGLGTMGLGIAQTFATAGFEVLAYDMLAPARASAAERLRAALAARVAKGAMTDAAMTGAMARVGVVRALADLAPADLVIEAIAEDLAAKRALFAALEAVVAAGSVLATNTSSLSVAAVAEGLQFGGRVVGLHFFNPAPVMRLVELVPHGATDRAARAVARQVCEAAGKVVITCPDQPGFVVNRCARPFYGEALALIEEGRAAAEIDAAMLAAGYRIGPLSLIDVIGADVHLAASEGVWRGLGSHPRYHVFDALRAQVAAGRLGRKSGAGFVFPGEVGPVRGDAGPADSGPADAAAIALRIEATLVNEALWLLAGGEVAAGDIDLGLRLGLNFPRGPFEILARHGMGCIRAVLAGLEAAAPAHLKGRYVAAPEPPAGVFLPR